jgi:hypothetical protein
VFFSLCFALRERQGRTEAVEAKMQEEKEIASLPFSLAKQQKWFAKN